MQPVVLFPAPLQERLVDPHRFVGDVAQVLRRPGVAEERHLYVPARILDRLQRVREVVVPADENGDVVEIAMGVIEDVGSNLDVDALSRKPAQSGQLR